MLIKLNARNQITLPKSLMQAVGPTDCFDVETKGGQIVLTPVRFFAADALRAKLAELGITETDTTAAVDWARAQAPTT
ncbi:AbrB/MazE/SpoVT family DNA-binding domain-containing protein [Limnohabitans sp. Jir72]|uniref:AbrB/MazE/SpoVT family DNA-binding domain-containing protein n=1 Tax=Limnohabitans sp. Jir72 TaxID=1977909 RepID=UPI000D363AD9|nr:AbrB/MazE/SpoVT family DNA-binding domain-containing protein [Limnohabitans sp. Jir72]PUE31943.1 AbrB family transcriptional regulator [Limnohabitans sp. Jir72]